jgi:hypothetical protein
MAFESWRYQDPSEIVEASMRLTLKEERHAAHGDRQSHRPQRVRIWDEHYRQARRIHIKKLMKGRP